LITATCGGFKEYFTTVTYSLSKNKLPHRRGTYMHAAMQYFQSAPAYFATAVSYACKIIMKSAPGIDVAKLFTAVIYKFS